MTTKIFKPEALLAPADFTLELDIPEYSYPQNNPDGTRPVVSLKVEASTIKFGLAAMYAAREGDSFLDAIAYTLVGEDNYDEVVDADIDAFGELMHQQHDPFLSFGVSAKGEPGETVELTLTAPSGYIALMAYTAMTSDAKLSQLATSFMPDADDEDEFYLDEDEDNFFDDDDEDNDDEIRG